jgi:acetoin utilization protein AcuB
MLKQIKVREWMSTPVLTIESTTPVTAAHSILKGEHIRRLPVVSKGHLVGIVTLGDIREAMPSDATTLSVWEMNELLDELAVEAIMSRDIVTIGPDDTVFTAAELMLAHKISGLPVIDKTGNLIGMLTESDIFRLVIRENTVPEAAQTPAPSH